MSTETLSKAKQVAEWLAKFPQVIVASPVRVTIGKETFEGALYTEHHARGDQTGTSFPEQCLYLLGTLPKPYQKRRRTCFTCANDSAEWYISGYADAKSLAPRFAEFHPFGLSFMLRPWTLVEKIDAHEWHKGEKVFYTRVPMQIRKESSK